jgi:hypothetical protein
VHNSPYGFAPLRAGDTEDFAVVLLRDGHDFGFVAANDRRTSRGAEHKVKMMHLG